MKTNVLLFEYFAYWDITDYEIDSNNDWRQKHYPHARIIYSRLLYVVIETESSY